MSLLIIILIVILTIILIIKLHKAGKDVSDRYEDTLDAMGIDPKKWKGKDNGNED